MPTKFARVRHKATGHEFTIAAAAVGDMHKVLDVPAVDASGRPLRAIHKTSAPKKAAPASTPETHNSKKEL